MKGLTQIARHVKLNIFKDNANSNFKFYIPLKERNTPKTVLPEKIYNDFNRESYKRHNIKFPIYIPNSFRPVLTRKDPSKYTRVKPSEINYAIYTGNEILLSLKDFNSYTKDENLEALYQLSKKPKASELDLENHEYVAPVIQSFRKHLSQMTMKHLIKFIRVAKGLNLKSEELWEKVKEIGFNKIYAFEKLPSTYFAEFLITVVNMGTMTDGEKELLFDQLGRHLPDMHPDSITDTFEVMINKGHITSTSDHLFERHYMRHFWKTPKKFRPNHFIKILKGLKKLNYVQEDEEFFVYEFLPFMKRHVIVSDKLDELSALLIEVSELRDYGLADEDVKQSENFILERLAFLEQNNDLLKKTEFVEIVKSDLKEYKRLKMNNEL